MISSMTRARTAARGAARALGLSLLAVLPSACEEPLGFEETIVQAIEWAHARDGAELQERQIAAAVAPQEAKGLRLDLGGEVGTFYVRLGD